MSKTAILVDYYYCSGCHTCEIACATTHNVPNDQAGVVLTHVGPWAALDGTWEDIFIPSFTKNCNLCSEGEAAHDGVPMCMHHCQSQCIKIGNVESLIDDFAKSKRAVMYSA